MVDARSVAQRAAELGERVARREGCELVDCEYRKEGKSWVLRLFIDREDGITIDDCARVSRGMSAGLDVEDLVPHKYNLEVSSPGINRPLRRPEDFDRFQGQRVKIKTHAPFRGLKEFVGTLAGLCEELVGVEVSGGQRFDIPLERVAKARLEPET